MKTDILGRNYGVSDKYKELAEAFLSDKVLIAYNQKTEQLLSQMPKPSMIMRGGYILGVDYDKSSPFYQLMEKVNELRQEHIRRVHPELHREIDRYNTQGRKWVEDMNNIMDIMEAEVKRSICMNKEIKQQSDEKQ